MKKILARGGIEFLAVLLGITLSFWVEEWRNETEQRKLLNNDCINILSDVNEDIITINKIIKKNQEILKSGKKIIELVSDSNEIDIDSIIVKLNTIGYPTFFGITRSYKLSYSTGRLNLYGDRTLVEEISILYDHYYERLRTNSELFDKVGMNFFDNFMLPIYHALFGMVYRENDIKNFVTDQTFTNHMIIFNSRVSYYLSILKATKTQLEKVNHVLENYLK
tara:strand:- start:78 stop:743 length:666 start_codon:yes stop_codon:yes gene_type:complete